MRLLAFIGLFFCGLASGQADQFFAPLREGQSRYDLTNGRTENLNKDEVKKGMQKVLTAAFNEELEAPDFVLKTKEVFKELFRTCDQRRVCVNKELKAICYVSRDMGAIDDVLLYLLLHHLDEDTTKVPGLVSYYYKLEFTNSLRFKMGEDNSFVTLNRFNEEIRYRKREKGYGRLTPRQRLYLFYSEQEIEEMAVILKRFLNRNFSDESLLIFRNKGEADDTIELSQTEKYKAAVKLFDRDIKRAHENEKIRRLPLYVDMLTVGIETGIISINMLNEMIQMPEIQDPFTPLWKKVGNVALQFGRTVLVLNPTTSIYAMTAFLVIDSVRQMQEENDKVSDDHIF